MEKIIRSIFEPFTKSTAKEKTIYIVLVLLVLIITTSHHLFSINNIRTNEEARAIELADTTAALIFTDHTTPSSTATALTQFVEKNERIYYAFILENTDGEVSINVDATFTDTGIQHNLRESIDKSHAFADKVFANEEAVVTQPIVSGNESWVHALTPVYNQDNEFYAVLGLTYNSAEWSVGIYRQLLHNILFILMLWGLMLTVIALRHKHQQLLRNTEELSESERSKASFLSYTGGMVYRCKNDRDWTMELVSQGCYDLTGYKPEDLINNKNISYNELIDEDQQTLIRKEWDRVLARRQDYSGEYKITTKQGEIKWVVEYGHGIYGGDGSIVALEGIVYDITDRKIKEQQLDFLRGHDLLTGLYNRKYMEEQLVHFNDEKFLPFTIMLCDVEGLRMINDAYGQNMGDYVIRESAKLVRTQIGDDGIVANMGAGEFMVLLPNTDQDAAHIIKNNIHFALGQHNKNNKQASQQLNLSIVYETRKSMAITIEEFTRRVGENLKKTKLLNQHSTHFSIVSSIMATLYAKSQSTEKHAVRLGNLANAIGERLGLSQNELNDLRLLAQLHDIGKIGVNDQILNKPGPLTKEEWAVMKQHPQIGHDILNTIPQLAHIADYVLKHHEYWDGNGYPAGLAGEEIPLIARILSVADAYDAMIEDRVYRQALTREEAISEIKQNSGTQFDPKIVDVFIQLVEQEERGF